MLSPLLFPVYIDRLLIRRKEIGVGCHMTIYFIGPLAFADDFNLPAPTLFGLKLMYLNNMLMNSILSSMDQNVIHTYSREGTVIFQVVVSLLMVYH